MKAASPTINQRFDKIEIEREEFRQMGHDLVDRIAGLFQDLPNKPITGSNSSDTIREMISSIAPLSETGHDASDLLEKTTDLLLEHSLFNGHPKFWGYITSSPAPLGVLGDLLAAAVNANAGAWVLSPVATEIERLTIEWIAQFMGYPAGGGLLVSGGNMANNVCFLAALRAKTGQQIRKSGLRGLDKALTIYCSSETHTWIQKAADLFGLGTDSVRWIATDTTGQMDVISLENKIVEDLAAGYQPVMVVGTAGSVSTGVVDSLSEIAALCNKYKLWFHVDGAYGGFAAALPELKEKFKGLEAADSVAVDPHKWLYAPLEAGCALIKDAKHLTDTFSYHPPYYNFEQAGLNYVDYGPQNSRGFRALKVWLSAQHLGMNGHRQLIREDIQLAHYAYNKFAELNDFEVLTCHLSITTFRYVPKELRSKTGEEETELQLNQLNQKILNRIESEGKYFISKAVIGNKFALRMCIVNFRTTATDIDGFPTYVKGVAEISLLEAN